MIQKIPSLVGVFFLLGINHGLAQTPEAPAGQAPAAASAQAPEAAAPPLIPAATQSEIECSGFIAAKPVSADTYVFDGADNDFRSPYRQFVTGHFVYLRGKSGAVGAEYRLVRPATGSIFGAAQLPIFGRGTWYSRQGGAIGSLGEAYEDVGRVKVVTATPQGLVAQVTFACTPVTLGDLAMPFQAREIPAYNPSLTFDPFAPAPENRKRGSITAAMGNAGALANGSIAYVSLGEKDGARAGQRYRIVHVDRNIPGRWISFSTPPAETVGELVVLFTQERSSVAIVISNLREIALGDGVTPE